MLNNLFKGIVDLSLPSSVKYLFWSCKSNRGLFDLEGQDPFPSFSQKSEGSNDEDMIDEEQAAPKESSSVSCSSNNPSPVIKLRPRRPTKYTVDKLRKHQTV